ncbi:MAG: hypothetical protein QMD78_04960 [Methanocellales archaeon]|nr:hypothetical protein [Methanocellales archaeon]
MSEEVVKDIVSQAVRHHALKCPYKVVCDAPTGACPKVVPKVISAFRPPDCFIRRQRVWYKMEWNDLKTISWIEVLSLKSPLMFALLLIAGNVLLSLVIVLIHLIRGS